jgi:hypothetical protein
MELLRANPEKIRWQILSTNPNAIDILRDNPDKIDWDLLSQNHNAIDLLQAHPEKISWLGLWWVSVNPSIFELDYEKMKESKHELNQAIIAEAWHPKRVSKWIEQGIELEEL